MKSNYNKNRNKPDFVNAIHFNMNGKKMCSVTTMNPQHTTDKTEVTCKLCKSKLEKLDVAQK